MSAAPYYPPDPFFDELQLSDVFDSSDAAPDYLPFTDKVPIVPSRQKSVAPPVYSPLQPHRHRPVTPPYRRDIKLVNHDKPDASLLIMQLIYVCQPRSKRAKLMLIGLIIFLALFGAFTCLKLTVEHFTDTSGDAVEMRRKPEALLMPLIPRWTPAQAHEWYDSQPWIIGSNYIPAYASNQLEMWQPETFDINAIDEELKLAQQLGMNTMRVFLHDILYTTNKTTFLQNLETFLQVASHRGLRPVLAFFDSCWDPVSAPGRQKKPIPYVHNSRWLQSPNAKTLSNPAMYPILKKYVQDVIGAYREDPRVLAWDLWNEPDNANYQRFSGEAPGKTDLVYRLLPQVFQWAREMEPTQPLLSGVWKWDRGADLVTENKIPELQLELSDIITFHTYGKPWAFEHIVERMREYGRPVFCTEWLARPKGSTVTDILPLAKSLNVGMINWGFVTGKTQTNYPWDSWHKDYDEDPGIWFHDLFLPDGQPYRFVEYDTFRSLTGKTTRKRKGRTIKRRPGESYDG